MLDKLRSMFTKSTVDSEVTLLIIGPPSSGKTALIYFLYRFAATYLTGKKKRPGDSPGNTGASQVTNIIREMELVDFINEMIKQIVTSKDFIGTEIGRVDVINHFTGLFNLKIYNISGEIFHKPGAEKETTTSLIELARHLDNSEIENVHCLLVDDVKEGKKFKSRISMFEVSNFFSKKEFKNTHLIFDNINKGINTLRIVTKFDRKYEPVKPSRANIIKNKEDREEFIIYAKALEILNQEDYFDNHSISYKTHEWSSFVGTKSRPFYKAFISSGLYDRRTFSIDLYDEEFDKPVLKEEYWNYGLNLLEMYGVKEIFMYVLRNQKISKKINKLQPYSTGRSEDYPISVSDYTSILR